MIYPRKTLRVATIDDLVRRLGPAILDVVTLPGGGELEITEVVIHDVSDPTEPGPGGLMLGVGVGSSEEATALVRQMRAGVVGVVLKQPWSDDPSVVAAAQEAGIALLRVPQGASWWQVGALLQSALVSPLTSAGDSAEDAFADLFTFADSVATLVDAPVTIEDVLSRVIAYSGRQDEADRVRTETILGRRVPERVLRELKELSVFERLADSDEVIFIEPSRVEEDMMGRMVVPVRAGQDFLGSMWAAVTSKPSSAQRQKFREAARVAALHLLRHRATTDVERRIESELLGAILDGSPYGPDAADRLGIAPHGYRVIAVWVQGEDASDSESLRKQVRDALSLHQQILRTTGAVSVLTGVVYALISGRSEDATRRLALELTRAIIGRSAGGSVVAGVGRHAGHLKQVPLSRKQAEDALRVLRRTGATDCVATFDDVFSKALLLRFGDIVGNQADIYRAKLAPLLESDETGGTEYVRTLRAYLMAFGDFGTAAEELHVHPTTVRYRLRRAQEIANLRLDDPEERLALTLLSVSALG